MVKLWNWLDGKKTTIAGIYWLAVEQILPVIFVDGIPENYEKWIKVVGIILLYLGLGHKVIKKI